MYKFRSHAFVGEARTSRRTRKITDKKFRRSWTRNYGQKYKLALLREQATQHGGRVKQAVIYTLQAAHLPRPVITSSHRMSITTSVNKILMPARDNVIGFLTVERGVTRPDERFVSPPRRPAWRAREIVRVSVSEIRIACSLLHARSCAFVPEHRRSSNNNC